MSAIGPGDWVECVAPTRRPDLCVPGGIYCVEAIVEAIGDCPACGDDTPEGLIFRGQAREYAFDDLLMSWCPCRFRPIYRPSADLIEQLKQPAPDAVRETVFAE